MIPKFRAWDKEKNEMKRVMTIYFLENAVELHQEDGEEPEYKAFNEIELMESTQFHTAWGDLIYEGDVMAAIIDGERKHTNFTVVCGGGKYGMIGKKIDKSGFIFVQLDRINGCKMLGNIYENPELLEAAE